MLTQPRRRLDRWAVVAIGRENVCSVELVTPGHGHEVNGKHDVDGLLYHDLGRFVSHRNGQQIVEHPTVDLYSKRVQVLALLRPV